MILITITVNNNKVMLIWLSVIPEVSTKIDLLLETTLENEN